ncbi:MAG: heavy-metal-associated domain-containing protein [Actinomycetota bacterium]|nr:heavy-metal-associated domain-containing protein [Actinomycetota bacterium]
MAVSSISISGTAVSCAHCLSLLINGLEQLDGIVSVSADKKTNTLSIDFDPSISDADDIRARLRDLGFAAGELYCVC